MKHILLVEDEESLQQVLQMNLSLEGYDVSLVSDGALVESTFEAHTFDLIVLDIMLPNVNGFDICSRIRQKSDVPILFISAKDTSTDRIKGLKIGGDDYLVKPFHLEEFLLRVKNLIGRFSNTPSLNTDVFTFKNGNHINFKTYEIHSFLGDFTLSKKEIDLLQLLINKENQVVSRDEILNAIWPENASPNSRTIDNYVLNFRKHFEETPKQPKHFISLRGVGYKFIS